MPSEKFIGQNVVGPSNIRPQSITVLNFTPNTFDSSSLEIVNGRVSVRAGATELGGQMVNVLSDASSANSIVLNSVVQAALTGSGWGGESPLELFTSSGTFFYYGTQLTNYYAASGNRIQFRYGGTYDINVHVSVLAGQDDTSGARAFGLSLDTNGTSAWNTVVDGTHRWAAQSVPVGRATAGGYVGLMFTTSFASGDYFQLKTRAAWEGASGFDDTIDDTVYYGGITIQHVSEIAMTTG